MRAAIVAMWNGLGRLGRILIGFAGLLIVAVLGLSLALAFTGGSSKSASPTTGTALKPTTTASTAASTPSTTTPTSTSTTSSTTATAATAAPTTPAQPATTPASPGSTTNGGGPIRPTGSTVSTTFPTVVVQQIPLVVRGRVSPHGFLVNVKFLGAAKLGATVHFVAVVYKATDGTADNPIIGLDEGNDHGATGNYARTHYDTSKFNFVPGSGGNLIQMPSLAAGSWFSFYGTLEIPNWTGQEVHEYCVSWRLMHFGQYYSIDKNGNPIPQWTDTPVEQICIPLLG